MYSIGFSLFPSKRKSPMAKPTYGDGIQKLVAFGNCSFCHLFAGAAGSILAGIPTALALLLLLLPPMGFFPCKKEKLGTPLMSVLATYSENKRQRTDSSHRLSCPSRCFGTSSWPFPAQDTLIDGASYFWAGCTRPAARNR